MQGLRNGGMAVGSFITIPHTHIPLYLKAEQYDWSKESKSGKLEEKEKLQFKFTLERKSKSGFSSIIYFPLFSAMEKQ